MGKNEQVKTNPFRERNNCCIRLCFGQTVPVTSVVYEKQLLQDGKDGGEGFGALTLVQCSKIQLNQLCYKQRVPVSQRNFPKTSKLYPRDCLSNESPDSLWRGWRGYNWLFAGGGHVITANLNQSAMTKQYPETKRADSHELNDKVAAIDFKYVKITSNRKQDIFQGFV